MAAVLGILLSFVRVAKDVNAGFSAIAAFGRVLLALIFVRAGIGKIGAIAPTTANMAAHS
jgi:uncharacterized membrane protein YphA (DoxX/SURF4 family)